jgi:hypothetical protein
MPVCSATANSTMRSGLTTMAGKMLPDERTGGDVRSSGLALPMEPGSGRDVFQPTPMWYRNSKGDQLC